MNRSSNSILSCITLSHTIGRWKSRRGMIKDLAKLRDVKNWKHPILWKARKRQRGKNRKVG